MAFHAAAAFGHVKTVQICIELKVEKDILDPQFSHLAEMKLVLHVSPH